MEDEPWVLKVQDGSRLRDPARVAAVCSAAAEAKFTPAYRADRSGQIIGERFGVFYSLQRRTTAGPLHEAFEPERLGERVAALHRVLRERCEGPCNHIDAKVVSVAPLLQEFGLGEYAALAGGVEEDLRERPRQAVHGDLHPANIRLLGDQPLFLDFDSATASDVRLELAFSAFRTYGTDRDRLQAVLEGYAREGGAFIDPGKLGEVFHLVAYTTLKRILYIRIHERAGDRRWSHDLPNQFGYLQQATGALRA